MPPEMQTHKQSTGAAGRDRGRGDTCRSLPLAVDKSDRGQRPGDVEGRATRSPCLQVRSDDGDSKMVLPQDVPEGRRGGSGSARRSASSRARIRDGEIPQRIDRSVKSNDIGRLLHIGPWRMATAGAAIDPVRGRRLHRFRDPPPLAPRRRRVPICPDLAAWTETAGAMSAAAAGRREATAIPPARCRDRHSMCRASHGWYDDRQGPCARCRSPPASSSSPDWCPSRRRCRRRGGSCARRPAGTPSRRVRRGAFTATDGTYTSRMGYHDRLLALTFLQ